MQTKSVFAKARRIFIVSNQKVSLEIGIVRYAFMIKNTNLKRGGGGGGRGGGGISQTHSFFLISVTILCIE